MLVQAGFRNWWRRSSESLPRGWMVSAVSLHCQGATAVCNEYVCLCLLELSGGSNIISESKAMASLAQQGCVGDTRV